MFSMWRIPSAASKEQTPKASSSFKPGYPDLGFPHESDVGCVGGGFNKVRRHHILPSMTRAGSRFPPTTIPPILATGLDVG
jgi:hypothetical protein